MIDIAEKVEGVPRLYDMGKEEEFEGKLKIQGTNKYWSKCHSLSRHLKSLKRERIKRMAIWG